MLKVRKNQAGASSHGHVWPHDGAVVEVPVEDANELVAIPDGGFSVVHVPEPEPRPEPVKPSPRRRAADAGE